MTYAEFWPRYLRQHRRIATQRVHALGTCLGLGLLLAALMTLDWRFAVAALVLGYGTAWASHAFIERNRPATFSHPLWSLASDLRMTALLLSGRMLRELERHGISDETSVRSGRQP